MFRLLIEEFCAEHDVDSMDVAAALVGQIQRKRPFLLKEEARERTETGFSGKGQSTSRNGKHVERPLEDGMERYRIEVGRKHGVLPGNIVGAISGETGLPSRCIGRIRLFEDFSIVDLPHGMPDHLMKKLQVAWICRRQMAISLDQGALKPAAASPRPKKKSSVARKRKAMGNKRSSSGMSAPRCRSRGR